MLFYDLLIRAIPWLLGLKRAIYVELGTLLATLEVSDLQVDLA